MKKNIIYVDFVKKRKITHFHYIINRIIDYFNSELLNKRLPSKNVITNKYHRKLIEKIY